MESSVLSPAHPPANVLNVGWMNLVVGLSWPAVVLIIFFFLRRPIAALIPKLRSLRGPGGWQVEFGEQAAQVKEAAREALSETTGQAGTHELEGRSESSSNLVGELTLGLEGSPTWVDSLRRLTVTAPRSVVIESFLRVEEELRRLDGPQQRRIPVRRVVDRLVGHQVIPANLRPLVLELAGMRNQVTHVSDFEVPTAAANAYLDAAADVVQLLARLSPDPTVSSDHGDGAAAWDQSDR